LNTTGTLFPLNCELSSRARTAGKHAEGRQEKRDAPSTCCSAAVMAAVPRTACSCRRGRQSHQRFRDGGDGGINAAVGGARACRRGGVSAPVDGRNRILLGFAHRCWRGRRCSTCAGGGGSSATRGHAMHASVQRCAGRAAALDRSPCLRVVDGVAGRYCDGTVTGREGQASAGLRLQQAAGAERRVTACASVTCLCQHASSCSNWVVWWCRGCRAELGRTVQAALRVARVPALWWW
jgi:hypothetical protein